MSVCSISFRPTLSPSHQVTPARGIGHVPKVGLRPAQHAAPLGLFQPASAKPGVFLLGGLRRPQPCRAQPSSERRSDSFSHNLFMETIDYHKRINVHPAIEALRGSKVESARIYWRMLVDKLVFHEALETLLAKYKHEPLLDPFQAPVLARSKRLRADLYALSQKPHAHVPRPARASQAAYHYIEMLDVAARRDPRALAAHAWLHYLGDMHGGQLMQGRLAERHGDDTVSCFAFTQSVEALRKAYGRALDVPLTSYEERLLREHAVAVYEHSLKMHDLWVNP